jgi:hypothetical protein
MSAWGEVSENVSHMVRVVAILAFLAYIAHGFYLLIMACK